MLCGLRVRLSGSPVSPSNPKDEKEMDLHNNGVGLSIGRVGGSDQVLSQICIEKLVKGELKVLVK